MSKRVLTQAALQEEMNKVISEISEMIEASPGSIRILLNRFKWDKDRLMEKFYESPSEDEFLRSARVSVHPNNMGDGVDGEELECGICCDVAILTGPSCRHYACGPCWEQYLSTKVLSNNSQIECPYPGCKLLLEDEQVVSLIGSNETAQRAFARLSINGFVESNRSLRWCPAADCGRAIKASDSIKSVRCACGCRFCFECSREWHEPVDCKLLKSWEQKCKDDSETSNWINANTKDCPKCNVTIEKNGGCNHITCRQPSCKHEFCWLCGATWFEHNSTNHSCNKYDESAEKGNSRAALERYLHYYNRFVAHQNSLRLEAKLVEKVKEQQLMMQNMSMTWIEVQFLEKAVEALSDCRRTLMYTYAFAFYIEKSSHAVIFEENQADMELATEQLSGFLEADLTFEVLSELKQKVQDKQHYVLQRREALLRHCAEEEDNGTWKINQL